MKNILRDPKKIKTQLMNINEKELFLDSLKDLNIDISKFEQILKNINYEEINKKFYPEKKTAILSKEKSIDIYDNFIIVNEDLLQLFIDNFKINNNQIFHHIYGSNKNLIIINNSEQHTIIFGSIIKNESIFKLKYIFNFSSEEYLKKELEEIIKNYNSYYNYLNKELEHNNILPLFENDNIIGICYKYDINLLDKKGKNINYISYNISNKLVSDIKFYATYMKLYMKLNRKIIIDEKNCSEKCYLVDSKWINEYKVIYNYEKINQQLNKDKNILNILNDNNDNISLQKIYSIIARLPTDFIKEMNKKYNNENSSNININTNIKPNMILIKYYDYSQQKKEINIYDNFEILNQKIVELLKIENRLDNKNSSDYYICDDYIIINNNNFLINGNKYISMIGQLNENDNFMTKYLLIYDTNNEERYLHINTIKKDIKKYLNELQLLKKSAPITIGENYKIIGTIVELGEKNIKNIKDIFKHCPHIGLQNIGATCYMNATLQCFCHIEKFINFFKYSSQINNIIQNNKNNLSSSFKLLIEKLWPDNYDNNNNSYKYYAPDEFKNKISNMNELFKGIEANDSKDLVNFIIMTLHEELNKAENIFDHNNNSNNNNSNNNSNNSILDQSNQQLIFKHFMKSFTSKNQSIISDLFYSTICTITQCFNCHLKLYNYQIYFFIVFPLEEIRKFKNKNNNQVNIYDCFDYDRKITTMMGNNSIYCNFCKKNCNGFMFSYLVTGPEILILLLNRGKGIQYNIKINFCEVLNLSNYIEYNGTGFKYKLIGVITHIGDNSMSGHFIAYCRDPINEKWYKYNDAFVNEVNDFQKEVIDFAMPYLLFYQKIE